MAQMTRLGTQTAVAIAAVLLFVLAREAWRAMVG